MLELRNVSAGYSGLEVVRGVDLDVAEGEWVALVGLVGAGKSTLMRAIAGTVDLLGGTIRFLDEEIGDVAPHGRVRRGMSLVPEGRRLFAGMTVAENLAAGAFVVKDRQSASDEMERVLELFPLLAGRRRQQVGTLSGGEQQMCAIGRALMSRPRLLLVDELSLGLAPVVVEELLEALVRVRAGGTTLLVVEQDVERSLQVSDRAYHLRSGEIVSAGASSELLGDAGFKREYLGVA